MRLAGQDVAGGHFRRAERVVEVHLHLALEQLRLARCANAAFARERHFETRIEGTVEQWMTRDPITVGPDATNGEAAMMMIHGGFRHVPICDHGKLIGVVSIRDLLTLPNESPKGV